MINLQNSSFIEYNNFTKRVELCCTNTESQDSVAKIIDCSGSFALFTGDNKANYNDSLTVVGTNGGPSAYGTYDMAGQVDEWVDLPNSLNQECTEQYNRVSRTANSTNFLTNKQVKYRNYLTNGVRLVSSKQNIKIYDKYINLDNEEENNTANYSRIANWNNSYYGNITNVGTNGRASYYGTFDQNGLVWEWTNQLSKEPSQKINNENFKEIIETYIRGGSWYDNKLTLMRDSDTNRFVMSQDDGYATFGFRLCSQTGVVTDYCSVLVSGNSGLPETNTCNYNSMANWTSLVLPGSDNNVVTNITSVGTNGGPSCYNTFDQDGLVWELVLQNDANIFIPKYRGGSYASSPEAIGSSIYNYYDENLDLSYAGFRLASNQRNNDFSCFTQVSNIEINPEIVGSCGSFIGSVDNSFNIQKYPCTNNEYVSYLNNVDKPGNGDARFFNSTMTKYPNGGILIIKENAPGLRYVVRQNMGNKPVVGATVQNIARLVNWLHNKQNGQSQPGTEYGVYNLANGLIISQNKANYLSASLINSIEDIGDNGGPSSYGTFDQDGNVWELTNINRNAYKKDGLFTTNLGILAPTETVLVNEYYGCGGSFDSLEIGKKVYTEHQTLYGDGTTMGLRLASSYNDPLKYNYAISNKKNNFFIGISSTGSIVDSGVYLNNSSISFQHSPGKVDYNYSIMKHAITNEEYVQFLNDVDGTATNDKELYINNDYDIDNENNNFTNWYSVGLSNVGSNGGSSAYGIYNAISSNVNDQLAEYKYGGEWNNLVNNSGMVVSIRNGILGSSLDIQNVNLFDTKLYGTFRITTIQNLSSIENLALIEDSNNLADDNNGYGSVKYNYSIAKYPVTVQELTNFFNSVGKVTVDRYNLEFISSANKVALNTIKYNALTQKYECTKPKYPAQVSWLTAARYCNWLHNNKFNFTETGSYNLTPSFGSITRLSGAKYWIATSDEWHKAVYYKGDGLDSGYWKYATQSDEQPRSSRSIDSVGNTIFALSNTSKILIEKDINRPYGQKYYINENDRDKPVSHIDILKAIRFANWMHNRALGSNDTEDGAYNVSEVINNNTKPSKKSDARYWIPSLDEWYKAAYYDKKNNKYWNYATQNNSSPEYAVNPNFWIPDENEWYKAAYFNPVEKTYYNYATQSNTLPSGITRVDEYGNGPMVGLDLYDNGKLNNSYKPCDSEMVPYDLVPYSYNISRYPVTNNDYVRFLNENDPSGINVYNLYNNIMSDRLTIMIDSDATIGNKYYVYDNMNNKPVIGIDWYKAARYCNWLHNKISDSMLLISLPPTEYGVYNILGKNRNEIICEESYSVTNTANIGLFSRWISTDLGENRFSGPTSVGTNGSSSYYGTYDQNGNVAELIDGSVSNDNDYIYMTDWVRLLGGSWRDYDLTDHWKIFSRADYNSSVGFRLSSINNPINFSSFVNVGDIGNKKDESSGMGSVNYDYQIMEKEFTNDEYVTFLNNVDPSGLASNGNYFSNLAISGLYKTEMTEGYRGGILLDNSANIGFKYKSKEKMGNKPVNMITWFDAARVCNWLHNGGNALSSSLSGAYNIAENSALSYIRSSDAKYWLSTKNEWFKAAFYDPTKNKNTGGYWKYATQSDSEIFPVMANSDGDALGNYEFYIQDNAKYWIPTEKEWYKAAYHDPTKQSGVTQFWNYATQSNILPRPITTQEISNIGEGPYNFIECNNYNPIVKNYDTQCGTKVPTTTNNSIIDFSCFVYVDDAGNLGDTNGFGSVQKSYYIQKYPLSNYEYVQFLNDVDPQGTNINIFANNLTSMNYKDLKSPIRYEPGFGYLVPKDMKDKPAIGITWYTSARIANWLHNKINNINNVSIESGAYYLNMENTGIAPAGGNAMVRIPTADEWYKAAYYKRPTEISNNYMRSVTDMSSVGYWAYPTQSDSHPSNVSLID